MDYNRVDTHKDKEDFKMYAKILLDKLILINKPDSDNNKYENLIAGETDKKVVEIREELSKLNSPIAVKKDFLENIFNKFIKPHLYNYKGKIKFNRSLEGKIEKEKEVLRLLARFEEEAEQINKINLKKAEDKASKSIRDAGEKARREQNNRSGETGMLRKYYLASSRSRAQSGWDTGAVKFGPITYNTVRGNIGVPASNNHIFTTTEGRLPVGFNER